MYQTHTAFRGKRKGMTLAVLKRDCRYERRHLHQKSEKKIAERVQYVEVKQVQVMKDFRPEPLEFKMNLI